MPSHCDLQKRDVPAGKLPISRASAKIESVAKLYGTRGNKLSRSWASSGYHGKTASSQYRLSGRWLSFWRITMKG